MTGTSYSTPSIGLDAVVLDTEATGLDAASARVVQVGAVTIRGGVIDQFRRFEQRPVCGRHSNVYIAADLVGEGRL